MAARWWLIGTTVMFGLGVACSATDTGGGSGGGGNATSGGVGGQGLGGVGNLAGAGATSGGAGDSGTGTEICGDGQDNNGNLGADEGCSCALGTTQDCWLEAPERRGVGICHDGKQACMQTNEFATWGPCVGETDPQPEIPNNGLDDDCDGQGDPCVPTASYEVCGSGKDDDCNGLQDCADPQCNSVCNCSPENCGDGIDNDCDGAVDCNDSDCVGATECQQVPGCVPQFPYFIEILCKDGVDNDCDGKIDCADPDCIRPGDCGCAPTETNCSDGKDEDCDKSTDCSDLDCQKCTPGSFRYCDDPQYCHWGKQTCDSSGHWGACTETNDVPPGCGQGGTLYSTQCCIQAGFCCQNYPTDQSSVGNCSNTVTCN